MNLDALRTFCTLVDEGGFRRAADRVHRSQPAVSQQIKALERDSGQVLYDRRLGRPTAAGRLVYDRARVLLAAHEGLVRELADFDETKAGTLHLGASDTTALYYLPDAVRRFVGTLPHAHLVVVSRSSDAIGELVSRGSLDLGIVTLPASQDGLETQDLFGQQLVLVVPRGHRLVGTKNLPLEACANEPMLMLDPRTRTGAALERAMADRGFAPRRVLDSGSFEVIKRYAAEGVGLAFLPEIVVPANDPALARVRVEGLPTIRIGAIRRRGAYQSQAERVFLSLLAKADASSGVSPG